MDIKKISAAAGCGVNEDLISVFAHQGGVVDLLIFDGATGVSEKHYFDEQSGDAAWFVSKFSALLNDIAHPDMRQEDSVALALASLREQLRCQLDADIPAYSYPIAAMSWIRIRENADSVSLGIYALGDCKVLVLDKDLSVRDLDPYTNPQEDILKEAIARLRLSGIEDKTAIREHLLPMLRERRASQNTSASPGALCIDPQGAFNARVHALEIARGSRLLAMTDGFYRLVDTYGLYSAEALARQCAISGLSALMGELRRFEQDSQAAGNMSVKKTDDASAAICHFD
jgi:hypothetical protein